MSRRTVAAAHINRNTESSHFLLLSNGETWRPRHGRAFNQRKREKLLLPMGNFVGFRFPNFNHNLLVLEVCYQQQWINQLRGNSPEEL